MASKIIAVAAKLSLVWVALMSFGIMPAAQANQDECKSWIHRDYPVTMDVCSYPGGGSGYYKVTNNGNQAAKICWAIVAADGKKEKLCNSSINAGESSIGSYSRCGKSNGGCQQILLESYTAR